MQSKEQKQKTAAKLLEDRKSRTPQQQIAILDMRLGIGQGAIKERRRLASLISQ